MIDLININKNYKRNKKLIAALKNVNLHFENNGLVCVTGPSGSGKTTLLNIIYGNVLKTSGEIYHNNIPYDKSTIKKEFSYIFQEYNLIDELNIYDNLNLALKLNGIEKTKEEIEDKLKRLGLNEILSAYPYELSGGQQQRVAIARASLINSKVILADEPTGALDENTAKDVMNLLKEESKNKLVIVVSHNKELIKKYADQLIEMNDGEIVLNEIINNDNLNVEAEKEETNFKKNGFKYLLRLGIKYINFKSFKLYLSFLLMIISFTLLLLSVSFMFFNPEKSYDSINDKKYNYTLIKKCEIQTENSSFPLSFDITDLEKISVEKTLIYNKLISINSKNTNKDIYNIVIYDNNIMNKMNSKIVGRIPEKNEILVTKKVLDDLSVSDYSNLEVSGGLKVSGYIEIDYERYQNEYIDLNDAIYAYSVPDYYNSEVLLTSKLSFSEIDEINNLSTGNIKYYCDSLLLNSVNRASIFASEMNIIGTPIAITLIILDLLLLINCVYSNIDSNKQSIKIIKMIGGNTKDLSLIFGVQPTLIISISLIISYVLYFVIKSGINLYITEEFKMFIPILLLSFWKNVVIIFGVLFLLILTVVIPIKKTKYIK